MAKIEITKTELVWPGKYNEDGTLKEVPRVSLPFQVIERVNESRATREAKKGQTLSLFDVWEGKEGDTFEEGWRNKLIWGDNLLVMGSLLEKFAGKIDLIYIDPPFATGADFSFTTEIGESEEEVTKEQSAIEEKAYRDTWGRGIDSYLDMMRGRLSLLRDLLAPTGTMYVHIDWTVGHYLKLLLDEVFGRDNFRNELIWYYTNKLGTGGNTFDKHHDNLLVYVKGPKWVHNALMRPVREQKMQPVTRKIEGKRVWLRDDEGKRIYAMGSAETKVGDVWEVPYINPVAAERLGYATQKPEALLENVLRASSQEGDLVADFFCGSGTTLAVAEKLGRRWIGCDLGRWAIHVTRKRLLGIENCKPFEVLNLGKYERQYWQGVTFGEAKDKPLAERALYEYLAFILKLYGAQPLPGLAHLHGKKDKAMVHIGAVDAPVTIDEVNQALDECVALMQTELHVLGWEWEMGLAGPNNDVRKGSPMHEVAKQKGVKLLLLQIPREVMEQQAAEKGDVRFFELAYFEAKISQPKTLTVEVELTDFATPNAYLIPEDVRSKIKKRSDYIDYWAVDWDFQNDTFMQGWVAYRTRKERKLPLVSDQHTYEKPGKYRILVKVIDIFGNDTSQAFDVEVK
jgi:adenine-specific DNA-methyltransferase